MKVTCTFLLALLFLASCGQGNRNPATESQLGGSLLIGGTFSDVEKNIALRICYAFRSKNTNLRASLLEKDFKFLITDRSCNGRETTENLDTKLIAALSSGPMTFDGISNLDYFKNVETDKHGALAPVCSNLLQGGDPQRTILSGNRLIEMSFYTSSQDHIIVRTGVKKTGTDDYIVGTEERYRVETNSNSGTKVGRVTLATRDTACLNGRTGNLSQQIID